MEKRAITQPANALLPGAGFVPELLLAPEQALIAFFARVRVAPPGVERVAIDDAAGRVIASSVAADADYPAAPRSAMDGFALAAAGTPGAFTISGDVRMGESPHWQVERGCAARIPTGGMLPRGTDVVVPIEDARVEDGTVHVSDAFDAGTNVVERGADMRRGETILTPGTRVRAPQAGLLATLGVTQVAVYRRPVVGVFSSGDELVDPAETPEPGRIRDSNRYATAASLRAMGAEPRHYPRLADERDDFVRALSKALEECDAVTVSGGSSVGARDALPDAVAALGEPGVVVHGLRIKPGKPTLLGAAGGKPILGLPGNPTSALLVLEAVAAPIVTALTGARPAIARTASARLSAPLRSRAGWTWYVPVALRNEGAALLAHPLTLRSFSVSLAARADGYVVMGEGAEEWPADTPVAVQLFWGVR
jgi:molybdenum cofactor synthesis domain-containing protein